MKLKTVRSLIWALLLTLLSVLPASAQEAGPEKVIRDFYQWYIAELVAEHDPFEEGKADLAKYTTARLRTEIETARTSEDGLGADPFLSAQDFDKEWGKNITVSELEEKGETATAAVELKGSEMGAHAFKVALAKEEGAWKIDRVDEP